MLPAHRIDLLPFQKDAINELLKVDGLALIGQGLGLLELLVQLLHSVSDRRFLIFAMNCSAEEEDLLVHELTVVRGTFPLPKLVNPDMSAEERVRIYREGGIVFVSSRTIVVDLLQHRVSPSLLGGIVVNHGERVTHDSNEAFVLHLAKQLNRKCFIKALSDAPEALCSGFGKMGKVLEALKLSRIVLFPRFHLSVKESLREDAVDVVEMTVKMTPRMLRIQDAIFDAMKTCLEEVKAENPPLDLKELATVENAMFSSFDRAIRLQLKPVWHTTSSRTKKLVNDLSSLRRLLMLVIRDDAVGLYRYLEALRAEGPMWMFSSIGAKVFDAAKDRLYRIRNATAASSSSTGSALASSGAKPAEAITAHLVLEENPKWQVMFQILDEIAAQRAAKSAATTAPAAATASASDAENAAAQVTGRTLLVVGDERTARITEELLRRGRREFLLRQFCRWLRARTSHFASVSRIPGALRFPSSSGMGAGTGEEGASSSSSSSSSAASAVRPPPRKFRNLRGSAGALASSSSAVAGAGGASLVQSAMTAAGLGSGLFTAFSAAEEAALASLATSLFEQRRRAGKAASSSSSSSSSAAAAAAGSAGGVAGADGLELGLNDEHILQSHGGGDDDDDDGDAFLLDEDERQLFAKAELSADALARYERVFQMLDRSRSVIIYPKSHRNFDLLLENVQPRHVVLLDADVAMVRQIELFKAHHPGFAVRVFFVLYEQSVEQQKYLNTLRLEQSSFERLIRERSLHVPMCLDAATPGSGLSRAERLELEGNGSVSMQSSLLLSSAAAASAAGTDTRSGGSARQRMFSSLLAAAAADDPTRAPGSAGRVIVDVREVRSSLPSMLYQRNYELSIVTLEVGDYILSPEIAVERKSIADLIGSLNNGRLYQQAENMSRFYRIPVLLIEFQEDEAFSLQAERDLASTELSTLNILSKLVILSLHRPKLRLLWSRNAFATAGIFACLKSNHEEPVEAEAVAKGATEALDQRIVGRGGAVGAEVSVEAAAVADMSESTSAAPGISAAPGRSDTDVATSSMPPSSSSSLLPPVYSESLDMLRRMPGVTSQNIHVLLEEFDDLLALARASKQQLCALLGVQNGEKLHAFLSS